MSEQRLEGAPRAIECVGREKLEQRIQDINEWATREGLTVKYVSGMVALRGNPEGGWPQVFLVNGSSKGVPKEFWQFPGGYVHPDDPDHVLGLQRELDEELGVALPEQIAYLETYIPKMKPGATEVLAIHAFAMPVPEWDERTMTLGSDVSQFVWTDDPFRGEGEEPRILTEQVDFILRRVIGYSGPNNKNTCDDEMYNGIPASLAEMIREREESASLVEQGA
ncbi:NUDIX domain-containing protein [Patescibacteria group bacterium]|nr:NUDIX domain-containing protein [Patescibacteria group bacterium]